MEIEQSESQSYQVEFDIYGKEICQQNSFQSPELKKFYSQFAKEQNTQVSTEKTTQEQEHFNDFQEYNKENINPLTTDFVFTPLKPLANHYQNAISMYNTNNPMQENYNQYLQPPNAIFSSSYSPSQTIGQVNSSSRINRSPLNDITEQFYGTSEMTKKKASLQKLQQFNQLNSTPKPFYNQVYNNSKSNTKNLRI